MNKYQKKKDIGLMGFLLIMTILAALQIPKINVDGSSDIFIPQNHEVKRINEQIEKEFGSTDSIIVGVQVNFGTVLEKDILKLIDSLTIELQSQEFVKDVYSLSNSDYIKSSPEGMEVLPLLDQNSPMAIDTLKKRLMDWKEVYIGNIISKDNKLAVLIVQPEADLDDYEKSLIYLGIKDLTNKHKNANIRFPLAGMPLIKEEISKSILTDLTFLIPLVALLILVTLFIAFRKWEALLYPILSLFISCIWLLGLMGLLSMTFTMATMLVPILLLVVGSAYGIHLMSHFYEEVSHYKENISYEEFCKLLNKAVKNIKVSVLLAGLTTAGGFISQLSSPLMPFRAFGILSAIGIVFSQIALFLFIPSALRIQFHKGLQVASLQPSHVVKSKKNSKSIFRYFQFLTEKRKMIVLMISSFLLIWTVSLIPKMNIGINLIKFFNKESVVVKDTNVFNQKLNGTGMISLLIEAPKKGDILDPLFLRNTQNFENYLMDKHLSVTAVQTLVPHIKRINKIMNFDRVPYEKIEESNESFDFFSQGSFSNIDYLKEENSSKSQTSENMVPIEYARLSQMQESFALAMVSSSAYDNEKSIIRAWLAQFNYEGEAFDEIPSDPAKYGLNSYGEMQDLLSQYLLLYSGSLDWIINDSLEPDATVLKIQINNEETKIITAVMEDIKSYWSYHLPDDWKYSIGGTSSISHALSSLVTRSQLFSLVGALLIVFIIVSFMFRSFIAGFMGMIPVLFGVMGIFLFMILFNFNLDIVTSLLAALAIGIGVDYAIHFMNAYKRLVRENHKNILEKVYRTTGKAILVNAISVSVGFFVLVLSRFVPVQQLGILFSVSMIFASLASLILLPMALNHFKPKFLYK